MASVDDRIVRMEFDNASFERKLGTTLASLGQLDKALKFTGATKGLSDVSAAAEKVSFHTISQGIENVSKSFLALSTIALTTLSNITSTAIRSGLQFVKSFTIAPILDGFREFETNANSIQTILANTASKGTTLDQVSDALNRLNAYSDQTIYNFGQMARNIGTFTAAGVDLETSVSSIKGIANLAAMSGSNAEQASNAMYQLSQAIATGSLKLMDWNSVVNAGMGGEAFKSALFETGKAMGNVLNVPVDQTFKQWEDSGNSFRESLQDGWITAEILTTTLSAFTGDMTEEMLLAKGFNEQQATAILKTAAIAKAAATEVKTFTQLLGTVKEAVGTGFADSFRIVIGNFTEAKALFTNLNNVISGFVQKTADARNEILQGWKDFGSRTVLIDTLKTAFHNLALVIAPIKEAFSNIFPPITAATLVRLTESFKDFVTAMTPTAETIEKIRRIASGFFAALSIGWEIIKEGTAFIRRLAMSLISLVAPETTGFLLKLADGFTKLQEVLVKGGGIKAFFEGLTKVIQKPIDLLKKLKEAIGNIFGFFDENASDAASAGMERLGDRFESLKGIFSAAGNLWEPFENALLKIVEVLDRIWIAIKGWFKDFVNKIQNALSPGDFNNALDAVNTGLLGGIALLLAKFIKDGFTFDIGSGLLEKVGKSFEQLTGVLSAMQTNIKANALLKIAAAIAILTASVVVLSLIDSAALTRALTAMAVGFGQLMAAFTVLSKMASTPQGAASFSILAGGLILLATAILILSAAVAIMSTLDWEELGKGLTGVVGLLGALVIASKGFKGSSVSLIAAGIGITGVAIGLTILAVAMKIFATMSWEEIGKGLVGVAGGLVIIGAAMKGMPATMPITAIGLILVGAGLLIVASAVAIFGNMEWGTIGKGLAGIAGGLLIIAGAMNLMPISLPITAAGLVLVGFALTEIGAAMKIMGSMSWAELARGLVGMAGALAILAAAMFVMQANIGGAIAIGVAAVSLGLLAAVIKVFAGITWDDLFHGLAAVAISLGALALIAFALQPAIPIILSLGAALVVLGLGFALIGAGAMLVGKALESVAKSGAKAAKELPAVLKALGEAIPAFMTGLAQGLVNMTKVFIKSAPIFAKAIGKLLNAIIVELEKLIPKIGPIIRLLIEEIFKTVRSYAAEYIKTGFFILTKLLHGIESNIGEIVKTVSNIVVKFLEALRKEIPRIAQGIADTIIQAYKSAAFAIGQIAFTLMFEVALEFMKGFFQGLEQALGPVFIWFTELPGKVLSWIGDVARTLWDKGVEIIGGFFNGIIEKFNEVVEWFKGIPGAILGLFPGGEDLKNVLLEVGKKIMEGFKRGLEEIWKDIKDFIGSIAGWITDHKGPASKDKVLLYNNGILIMEGLHDGMKKQWGETQDWISSLDPTESLDKNFGNGMAAILGKIANEISLIEDFNPVITPVLDLTQVEAGVTKMHHHFRDPNKLRPRSSWRQAREISHHQRVNTQDTTSDIDPTIASGVVFTQTINSPTQLSTSDIYKQTRNQIRIAKEELKIP